MTGCTAWAAASRTGESPIGTDAGGRLYGRSRLVRQEPVGNARHEWECTECSLSDCLLAGAYAWETNRRRAKM